MISDQLFDDAEPIHDPDEKARIEALLSGKVKPFNAYERHFLEVVSGSDTCNSFRERQWILYTFDTRATRERSVWRVPDLGSPKYEGFHLRRFELLSSYAFMLDGVIQSIAGDLVMSDVESDESEELAWVDRRLADATQEELNAAREAKLDFVARYGAELKRLDDIFQASDREQVDWELDESPVMERPLDRPSISYVSMLDSIDGDSILERFNGNADREADEAIAQGIEPKPSTRLTVNEPDDEDPFASLPDSTPEPPDDPNTWLIEKRRREGGSSPF